ncbi:hypothetical protein BDF22DRAFT_743732 [Syncephalis plumigaleata]|nr:hypothetical protein BDF22DRAFT_743732 [Syncephalis plumigaleata]
MQHPPPMVETHGYHSGNAGYTTVGPTPSYYRPVANTYSSEELLTAPTLASKKHSTSNTSCWTRKRRPCSRLCHCCWCSCCCCSIVLLLLVIAIGLTAFFLWPRIPQVTFIGIKLVSLPSGSDFLSSGASAMFGNGPLSFESQWEVTVAVDSTNYIGWHFDKVNGEMIDPPSGRVVGTGNLTDFTLPGRANTTVTLPVQLTYKASSESSSTNSGDILNGLLSKVTDPMLTRVLTACKQKTKMPMTLKLSFLVPSFDGLAN